MDPDHRSRTRVRLLRLQRRNQKGPFITYTFGLVLTTDYGHPVKHFFIEIQNFWAWADKFWGIWGIFGQTISTHFGTVRDLAFERP